MKINKKLLSKKTVTNVSLVFMAVSIAAGALITTNQKTLAESCSTVQACDAQIDAKNQDKAKYEAEISRLSGEAQTLENTVNKLSSEKAIIQSQLDISQSTYDKLIVQIADTEKQIKTNQDALGKTIANMYVDDNITPLEMLASSNNIGDYLDKQEYRSSVRTNLASTITKIKQLKKDLDIKKIEAERVLADQKSQRDALAGKEAEQQKLLEDTKSNANAYQQISNALSSQIAQLRADRVGLGTTKGSNIPIQIGSVYYRNWSGNARCGGGYSYCNYSLDQSVSDPWGLYLAGECVHYVAWAVANRGYYIPYNAFNIGNGYGGGNAELWPSVATGEGFANLVSDPLNNAQRDDVAVIPTSGVGHVGIVESNYGNGWVRISQYNYAVEGSVPGYSTIDLKVTNNIQFLRFHR